MVRKALILLPVVILLTSAKGCQTLDQRATAAAEMQGQAKASSELPEHQDGSCTVHMERVKPKADEPRVVTLKRWDVVADNRDRQADDCSAWWDDFYARKAAAVTP
ncbi:hypothetical protein [Rhizobium sp. L51/94]|uniref:hypothetical protein n=1 Tax=Rhizobium sp. L51/94 TaxID=2819999 RepID=UPI001C5ACAC9|nr:hypothetical protein [Rhizobium sp. L51/94]QXZ79680.1 hypothetical protein J5274_06775 [Rhizobium sp. L51/94]